MLRVRLIYLVFAIIVRKAANTTVAATLLLILIDNYA